MRFRLVGWMIVAAVSGCMQSAAQVAPAECRPCRSASRSSARSPTNWNLRAHRAIESVNIVPRVTGYLVRSPFKEGSEVKADDLLFEIDARPYQAQLDQAQGQVNLYQAQLELAEDYTWRDQEISKTPGAVSLQQLDQDKAAVAEAEARVKAFQASTEVYKLNLSFTKVKAPITGQISRAFLTSAPGNLVNQDQTLLATIVSLDPIYVNFDMDEPTLLRLRRAVNEGRIKMPQDGIVHVYMGVQGEDGFPHEGTINFVNNQVNSTTGSISVRGIFPNPKPEHGARLLSPGMFVRVPMPLGEPHRSILVIDRAIGSDQGLKFVYVVDAVGPLWLADPTFSPTGSRMAVTVLAVWMGLGYYALITLTGLQNISADLYEAARLDGANALQIWWHITLPGLRPVLIFLGLTGTIDSMSRFADLWTLGGPDGAPSRSLVSAVMYIFRTGYVDGDLYRASAVATVFFLILLAITGVAYRVFIRDEFRAR